MIAYPISRDVRSDFSSLFGPGHQGIDIFAARGTPVLAVANGRARQAVEPKGGNAIYLTESDGTQYYYGHLESFEGPSVTRLVKAGDVLGYVGTSGSAKGTQPHIHFEYRPRGGGKVDPFDELNRVLQGGPPTEKKRIPRKRAPAKKAPSGFPTPKTDEGGGVLGALFLLWAMSGGF